MLIKNSCGRKDPRASGYFDIFAENDDDPLALKVSALISKIQATSIRNGIDLERLLTDKAFNPNKIFFKCSSHDKNLETGHYSKFRIHKEHFPKIKQKQYTEIDDITIEEDKMTIFEIKNGDNFDTKKSEAEIQCLSLACEYFKTLSTTKQIRFHIVLWNCKNLKTASIKADNIPENCIMTGAEFCEKYNIDYKAICKKRRDDAKDNKKYLLSELSKLEIFDD